MSVHPLSRWTIKIPSCPSDSKDWKTMKIPQEVKSKHWKSCESSSRESKRWSRLDFELVSTACRAPPLDLMDEAVTAIRVATPHPNWTVRVNRQSMAMQHKAAIMAPVVSQQKWWDTLPAKKFVSGFKLRLRFQPSARHTYACSCPECAGWIQSPANFSLAWCNCQPRSPC